MCSGEGGVGSSVRLSGGDADRVGAEGGEEAVAVADDVVDGYACSRRV